MAEALSDLKDPNEWERKLVIVFWPIAMVISVTVDTYKMAVERQR